MWIPRFEKALANWPKERRLRDGGVHITGKYISPKLDAGGGLAMFVGAIAGGMWGWESTQSYAVAAVAAFMGAVLLAMTIGVIFAKNVDVKIYPDRIAVWSFLGYKNYSRAIPIEFRVEQHHKALTERGGRRLYRNAIEAVMQYGEKRVPIAEMPEREFERARALVIRLQNVCNRVDLAMNEGKSTAGAAKESEFGPAPEIR